MWRLIKQKCTHFDVIGQRMCDDVTSNVSFFNFNTLRLNIKKSVFILSIHINRFNLCK